MTLTQEQAVKILKKNDKKRSPSEDKPGLTKGQTWFRAWLKENGVTIGGLTTVSGVGKTTLNSLAGSAKQGGWETLSQDRLESIARAMSYLTPISAQELADATGAQYTQFRDLSPFLSGVTIKIDNAEVKVNLGVNERDAAGPHVCIVEGRTVIEEKPSNNAERLGKLTSIQLV
jgi:hypothetical protein